jgi:hypothetical protein
MKKRIPVLLSVVALMVVMMVVTVAPAFAAAPPFHPTPSNFHASHNPSGEVSNCAVDPTCSEADVGAHHFDEGFPPGQPPGPPE